MRLNELKTLLFPQTAATVFAVLDGAVVPGLPDALRSFDPDYFSLYRGRLGPDMAQVAPYLVLLEREAAITDWVLSNGWGRRWGIYGESDAGLRELRKHLRRLAQVSDQTGKIHYFRFYDPAVIGNYLRRCGIKELEWFFGPVRRYMVEDVGPKKGRELSVVAGVLREEPLVLVQSRARSGEVSWKSEWKR